MAIVKAGREKYGVLELNNAIFRRDGAVEAQVRLDDTFTDAAPAEVGMLLAVDKAAGLAKLPTASETLPVALNYSTEKLYDQFKPGLNNFYQTFDKDFLPRLGYLKQGDKFTTNTLAYDNSTWTDDATFWTAIDAALTGGTAVYGGISTLGDILVSTTEPTAGPVLRAVKSYTVPNGERGIMFLVVKN